VQKTDWEKVQREAALTIRFFESENFCHGSKRYQDCQDPVANEF
jgi:hypothetical protein